LTAAFAQTDNSIPAWIKQNADWWGQGQTTDREFASAIAFLVKEDIIQVNNLEVDSEGAIVIDENISIPDWIKNNARWWAAGSITDGDFKSGIQYMLKEQIISFQERIINLQTESVKKIDPVILEKTYVALVWKKLMVGWILQMKNYQSELLQDAADASIQQYSEIKTEGNSQIMTQYQEASSAAKKDLQVITQQLSDISGNIEKYKDLARNADIHVLDLEKSTSIPLQKLEQVTKIRSDADYENAQDELKIAEEEASKALAVVLEMSGVDKNNILSYSEMAFLAQPIDFDDLSDTGVLENRAGTTIAADDSKAIMKFLPKSASSPVSVSITPISSKDISDEIKELGSIGTVYSLEPDGLVLEKPARIVIHLDKDDLGDTANGFSPIALYSKSSDGTIEKLKNQKIQYFADTGDAIVSGEVEHFTKNFLKIFPIDRFYNIMIEPSLLDVPVGKSFKVGFYIQGLQKEFSYPTVILKFFSSGSGVITLVTDNLPESFNITPNQTLFFSAWKCNKEGKAFISANVKFPGVGPYSLGMAKTEFQDRSTWYTRDSSVSVKATVYCHSGTVPVYPINTQPEYIPEWIKQNPNWWAPDEPVDETPEIDFYEMDFVGHLDLLAPEPESEDDEETDPLQDTIDELSGDEDNTFPNDDVDAPTGDGGPPTIEFDDESEPEVESVIPELIGTTPTADTTPPTITVPQNIVTESGGESTPVSFTVTANDNVDGSIAVSCDPSSGTIFPVGTTQVTCTATDSSDNTSQESFTVTVLPSEPVDSTPPVISVPSNTTTESSEELTPVTFNAISNDDVDGSITPTCNPPSGSLFPVGTTTVTCTATDSAGNTATKSFTVEVIFVDTKSPVITISSINSVESGDGFIVTFDATAEDNVDGSVEVTCNPPSGSFFPVGTHKITCTATDSAGNTATKSVDVTVTWVE
jgi:hypothetical protein